MQGLDEEVQQRIVVMEGLLHRFGVKTEARDFELQRWLVDSQVAYADLVKDIHELRQFTIVKVASCMTHLDLIERKMERSRNKVAQSTENFEALEKRVAVVEDVLV